MTQQWIIREDSGAFDIMDESGAHTTTDTATKANLIAAAPELHEKLKKALELLEEFMPDYYSSSFITESDNLFKKIDGEE